MENDIQAQLARQQEILRDLQSQLSQSTDEEEKKSLQLKMNVVDAKIKELRVKQSSAPVNEEAPEEVEELEIETPEEQLDESVYEVSKDDIRWDDKIVLKTAKFYGIAVAPDYDHTNHFLFAGNQKDLYRFINEILRHSPVRGQNFKVLKESLPSNYSKSKYLKEVQDATKTIRSVCDRIDKLAKKGDEWSMYSLPSDFKSIANFAERCAEDSKDIYSYMKKGTLTESQDEDYIIKQVCLYAKPQMFKSKGVTPAMLATAISDYIVTAPNSSDIFNVNHFAKILDKIITSRKENPDKHILQKVEKNCSKLFEGCMTKKFENMTNREIASYIFSHPHTKFASKMKECDDKEIMKAIRAMKKTEEEAPVTNTSAVATPEVPSMFMKRKLNESIDSDITEILDDVEDMYGAKARRDLRDEIYHRNYLVTRDSFADYAKQLSKTGKLRDFIDAIIKKDTYTFDKIVKKLK